MQRFMHQKRCETWWLRGTVICTLCNLFRNGYSSATVPLEDKLRNKLLSEIYFRQNIIKGAVTLCNLFRSLSCNDLIFKIVVVWTEMLDYATYLAIMNDAGRLRVFIGWCNFSNEICCRVPGIVAGTTSLSKNVARLDAW